MRLTRVEIHGFKSFADATTLNLPAGLTAVVGPNGCGKSNVIDAIKWALGEQKASALRGDEMLDVIFKGNGARTARNYAEVSLVFDNTDHTLPIDFNEVVVTRRLFRSGESEYLINRQPQRLKDVRNLFLDTGLGMGAYSIMEQGRIDAILSADAQDRRRIFEEAAGVSRYRSRRRETEARLERTEQNLLRLGDVVEELEKQVRSLKNQAGRARSYLAARDRLRGLKARFYSHRWEELGARLAQLTERAEAGERLEQQARARLEGCRAEHAALAGQLALARTDVDGAAERFRQATSAAEGIAARRAAVRERLSEAEGRSRQLAERLTGLQLALDERRREAEAMEGRLAELRAERAASETALGERETAGLKAEVALVDWRAGDDLRRRAALERQGELTREANRRADATARHAASSASHARVAERAAELRRQAQALSVLRGELDAGVQSLESALHEARVRLAHAREERQSAASGIEALDRSLLGLRERLAAAESRREALAELIARREGVSRGALALLQSGLPGIEGLVVDRLRAPRKLSEAVEAALGASAEAVLVASRADALGALQFLAERSAGRVLLLPRDGLRAREGAGAGERLLDRLKILGEEQALEALLGHVRLVPDRDALAHCQADGATVWVTPQGETLDERGLLRGGRSGGEGGLVTRQAECDALVVEALELREQLAAAQETRRAHELRLAEAQEHLLQSEAAARVVEAERVQTAERSRQAGVQSETLGRDLSVTERDVAALEGTLAQEAAVRDAAAAREQELAALVEQDREQAAGAEGRRETLEHALTGARAAAAEARLLYSTVRERQQALESEARQVARAAEERAGELASTQSEIGALAAAASGLAQECTDLEARELLLAEERDAAAGALNERRALAADIGERMAAAQGVATDAEAGLGAAGEALSRERLRLQEVTIHRETLREKVREELDVDLATQSLALLPLPGEEPEPEASASGDGGEDAQAAEDPRAEDGAAASDARALAADPAEDDWEAIEAEIERLRERMSRMGNVNLAALDELAEVESRVTFLVDQRDDLLAARATLMDTISAVNRESRERFVETFELIREHFRHIFRKLFRGGRADVFLAEGVDVLEAGIEIVAAPPGKDARSISLLSGGERTLTAVGLLFALFRARPSPVCMLDEVDAALDETNIDRFCTVLEDFLGGSQFLVVTHARRTMSYADTLYGITMQEHGVSKALSLTLREYDARQEGRHAAPADEASPANPASQGPSSGGPAPRAEVTSALDSSELAAEN